MTRLFHRLVRATLALLLPASGACAGGGPAPVPAVPASPAVASGTRDVAPRVEIRPLAPGVWLHTTWRDLPGSGPFPSHGLVVEDGPRLLLLDSAWGEEETVRLVAWLERELARPVERMISTHHHDDRLSGSGFLMERGTPVLAHPLTPALASEDGMVPPLTFPELSRAGSSTRVGPVEVFYPGPGHALDNLVVWIPAAGVLFGGCLVRPVGTGSLGNVADADLEGWPLAIERVLERYGDRLDGAVVVPGHGPPGGRALLEHTLALLRPEGPR